jgi:tRNA A-37 threonylcarbamoyl transferase component Bud32
MPDRSIDWTDLPQTLEGALRDPAAILQEMVESKSASIVKSNRERTIYHTHLLGNDLHIKQCRVVGWRAWIRGWLRPAKAMLEYRRLREAEKRGVSVISPIACGVMRSLKPSDSFLVTRTAIGAIQLSEWLAKAEAQGAANRVHLAKSLGEFFGRLHHAGIVHPDPHPGNLLIRWRPDGPELFLLDLHDAKIGRPVSVKKSLANLALLNRWFILRASRADRFRFWRAYVVMRYTLDPRCGVDYFSARALETLTRQSNDHLWRSRLSRCFGTNRRYRRIESAATSGHVVIDWNPEEIETIRPDPNRLFRQGATIIKDSRNSTVGLQTMNVGGQAAQVIIKRFRFRSRLRSIQRLLRIDACSRSWMNGHAFLECLLPTARPLAILHPRSRSMPAESFLISEYIPGAIDLRQALMQTDANSRASRTLLRQRIDRIARLIRDLHERGWSHRDLKAVNILLAPDRAGRESAWFIDLVGASRPSHLTQSRRIRDIGRLNTSFHELPALSRTDRLRFLRIYLNWNLRGPGGWKSWWRLIANRTRRKVRQNQRNGRPLA